MHGIAVGYAPTYLQDAVVRLSNLDTFKYEAHLYSSDSGEYDAMPTFVVVTPEHCLCRYY